MNAPTVADRHAHEGQWGSHAYVVAGEHATGAECARGAIDAEILAPSASGRSVAGKSPAQIYREELWEAIKGRSGETYAFLRAMPADAVLVPSGAPNDAENMAVLIGAWKWCRDNPPDVVDGAELVSYDHDGSSDVAPAASIGPASNVSKLQTLQSAGRHYGLERLPFQARIDGDEIVIESAGYPGKAAVEALKASAAWFQPTPPRWTLHIAEAGAAADLARRGFIDLGEASERINQEIARQIAAIEISRAADADYVVEGLGGELKGFQVAGVKAIVEAVKGKSTAGVLLADDQGLGKTVQAIAALHALRIARAIVVCPKSVAVNWAREIRAWIPGAEPCVLVGTKAGAIPAGATVAIVNYACVDAWRETLAAWDPVALVVDESHNVKSSKAARSKAVAELAKLGGVRLKLLMTGTPLLKSAYDLVKPLQILGRLDEIGGYQRFVRRHLGEKTFIRWNPETRKREENTVVDREKSLHLDELHDKLRRLGIMIRREKVHPGILDQLPPKTVRRVAVEIPAGPYLALVDKLRKTAAAARVEHAKAANEERDAASWSKGAAMNAIGELRRLIAKHKVEPVAEWCRDRIENDGEKLLIFAHHRALVGGIAEKLGAPMLHGDTPDRQAVVDRFQNDPDCRALVLNIQAGGVGITLTASAHVVFAEASFVDAENVQAEDRAWRYGQQLPVTITYLDAVLSGTGAPTADHIVAGICARKRAAAAEGITGGVDADAEMIARLAELMEAT